MNSLNIVFFDDVEIHGHLYESAFEVVIISKVVDPICTSKRKSDSG